MGRRIRVVEIVGNGEGGGAQCVAELVRRLDPQHFTVTAIAPESSLIAEACAAAQATYHPLPMLTRRLNRQLYQALASFLNEVEPDIINSHGPRAAWYSRRAMSRLMGAPAFVYSEHLFSFDARRGLARMPWLLVERSICRRADSVTTSCAANATLAESRGWIAAERIAMRHYGIDQQRIRSQVARPFSRMDLGVPAEAPLIGTVGRLVPQKGTRYFLDAARSIVDRMPSAIFLVVGDGELRAELERQSRQLGLTDQVRFLGANDEPWRILSACDVVAFASLWEGLPFTGIEALTAGCPVVFTRMKGTEELIRHGMNGLLVPPRDAKALADSIVLLLRAPSLRARLAAAGPASVDERDTDTMAQRFAALYERLCDERAMRPATLAVTAS